MRKNFKLNSCSKNEKEYDTLDLYQFYLGAALDAYTYFGAQVQPEGGVFSVHLHPMQNVYASSARQVTGKRSP